MSRYDDYRDAMQALAEEDLSRAEAREIVATHYDLSAGGTVQNPGRFEGEHWPAVVFYERLSYAESVYICGDCDCDEDGGLEFCPPPNYVFDPDPVMFPENPDDCPVVYINESGFVDFGLVTPDALAAYL